MMIKREKRSRAVGASLYVMTLTCTSAVSGLPRFAVAYALLVLSGLMVGLPAEPMALALLLAVAPVIYSIAGVLRPLRGVLWRRRCGAREPVKEEWELIEQAIERLADIGEDLPGFECYVIDRPWPMAATRGRTVIVSRGLFSSEALAAQLAHELFHLKSMDARLSEGLHRIKLWGDPLRGGTNAGVSSVSNLAFEGRGGVVFGVARWLVRLAGGGDARNLFKAPWAWYWRQREFAADAYVVALGQGSELLAFLEEVELPLDRPQTGLLRAEFEHPYVIERVDRLRSALVG